MGKYIGKSRNVSILLYQLMCPAKYRKVIFDEEIDASLVEICSEISIRYEIEFIEIGTDLDHVYFLIQSVPTNSPQVIVELVKSITAKEMFRRHPDLRKKVGGSKFWTSGYFINTVGVSGNEKAIAKYVQNQGKEKEYKKIHVEQLKFELFESS